MANRNLCGIISRRKRWHGSIEQGIQDFGQFKIKASRMPETSGYYFSRNASATRSPSDLVSASCPECPTSDDRERVVR